jgi:hypothetical protein
MPTTTNSLPQLFASSSVTASRLGNAALAIYVSNLTILQVISVIISIAFLVGIVLIVINTGWLKVKAGRMQDTVLRTNIPQKEVRDSWKKAQAHFFAGDDNDLKVAIMEADQILESALRHAGVRGANLGERLKNIKQEQMPNLDEVWQAHKLRNQIAHEPGFKIKRDLAERALGIYEKALQELGVLDKS